MPMATMFHRIPRCIAKPLCIPNSDSTILACTLVQHNNTNIVLACIQRCCAPPLPSPPSYSRCRPRLRTAISVAFVAQWIPSPLSHSQFQSPPSLRRFLTPPSHSGSHPHRCTVVVVPTSHNHEGEDEIDCAKAATAMAVRRWGMKLTLRRRVIQNNGETAVMAMNVRR
jgi:hypothetical protein